MREWDSPALATMEGKGMNLWKNFSSCTILMKLPLIPTLLKRRVPFCVRFLPYIFVSKVEFLPQKNDKCILTLNCMNSTERQEVSIENSVKRTKEWQFVLCDRQYSFVLNNIMLMKTEYHIPVFIENFHV